MHSCFDFALRVPLVGRVYKRFSAHRMAVGRRTTDDGRTDDASKGGVPIGCQWVVRIGWPAMAVGGSTVSAVVRSSLFRRRCDREGPTADGPGALRSGSIDLRCVRHFFSFCRLHSVLEVEHVRPFLFVVCTPCYSCVHLALNLLLWFRTAGVQILLVTESYFCGLLLRNWTD